MTTSPGAAHETAATADGAALTFRGVDHVSLSVTNLDVSAKFYTQVLGFTVVLDFGYGLVCINKTTGFMLSLIRHPDGTGARFTHRQTGLDHLGLTARNKAELLGWERRLRELDVEFTPVQDSELGHHLNFRDPDGIALELYAPTDRFAAALDELRSREFSDEELLDGAEQLGLGAYVARRNLCFLDDLAGPEAQQPTTATTAAPMLASTSLSHLPPSSLPDTCPPAVSKRGRGGRHSAQTGQEAWHGSWLPGVSPLTPSRRAPRLGLPRRCATRAGGC
jgi:catechol 2,3-dioxygenase-like lactoylglutathione lyase family enzyme